MRLIRTVLQPVNIGLSRQFQRSQVIKTSSDLLHPVLIETSNLEHGSNIRWCGRSYAASASSETLETKKARGRVSKDVRKSMVENFVNKYREMNAGKFPTASEAMKDVGGSYYVIREILQELKYNSKMSSVYSKNTSVEKSANFVGRTVQGDCPIDEPKSSLHFDPENNKQETVDEDKKTFDESQSKDEPQESREASGRELLKVPTEDAEHKTKSSVWQNLKSYANGILGIWKRS